MLSENNSIYVSRLSYWIFGNSNNSEPCAPCIPAWIYPYINFHKRSFCSNGFWFYFLVNSQSSMINSQFSYYPLICMFSSIKANNLINRIYEMKDLFENLLEKNKEITIHQRNLQVLMTEVYKIINRSSPQIIDKVFYL